jgi:hypothetical protein
MVMKKKKLLKGFYSKRIILHENWCKSMEGKVLALTTTFAIFSIKLPIKLYSIKFPHFPVLNHKFINNFNTLSLINPFIGKLWFYLLLCCCANFKHLVNNFFPFCLNENVFFCFIPMMRPLVDSKLSSKHQKFRSFLTNTLSQAFSIFIWQKNRAESCTFPLCEQTKEEDE